MPNSFQVAFSGSGQSIIAEQTGYLKNISLNAVGIRSSGYLKTRAAIGCVFRLPTVLTPLKFRLSGSLKQPPHPAWHGINALSGSPEPWSAGG